MKLLRYLLVLGALALAAPAATQTNPGTSPLSIAKGGTAANTAAGARTSLGLGALSTVTPGTGVASALSINAGSPGAVAVTGPTGTLQAAQFPVLGGDVTTTGGSTSLTLVTVNTNVGTFGSATQCLAVTVNGKGLITAASAVTCTPSVSNVGGLGAGVATALGLVTNGSGGVVTATPTRAGDIFFWTGTTITMLAGNNAGTQVLQETAAGVPSWATAGVGTMTGVTPGGGLVSNTVAACSQVAISTSGTLSSAHCISAQTGTSLTITDSMRGQIITATNAAAQAYSIAQAGAASAFQSGWYLEIENNSTNAAGVITVTPATSQICAQGVCATTYKIQPGQFARLTSDGANYQITSNPYSGQVPGTVTNDNANAGNLGEFISSQLPIASALSLSTGSVLTITSMPLSAGDWDVWGMVGFNGAASTTVGVVTGSISLVNNVHDTTQVPVNTYYNNVAVFAQAALRLPVGTSRISVATSTTVFLVESLTFGTSTAVGFGNLNARRMR